MVFPMVPRSNFQNTSTLYKSSFLHELTTVEEPSFRNVFDSGLSRTGMDTTGSPSVGMTGALGMGSGLGFGPGIGHPPGSNVIPQDMNNYQPIAAIPLGNCRAIKLQVITNSASKETIVAVAFSTDITFYSLKTTVNPQGQMQAELQHLQTCTQLSCPMSFSIHPFTDLSGSKRRLSFAFSNAAVNSALYVNQLDDDIVPLLDVSSNPKCVKKLNGLDFSVTQSSFDPYSGDILACLLDNPSFVVWNLNPFEKHITFTLRSRGVALMWHKDEPLKLCVAEIDGFIKFFNVAKQVSVRTINVGSSPILSIDWSPINSLLIAAGTRGGAFIIDTSQTSSSTTRRVETPMSLVTRIKFSTTDPKLFVALLEPQGEIQLWQQNFNCRVWSQGTKRTRDIAWVPHKPFLLAIIENKLCVFYASIY